LIVLDTNVVSELMRRSPAERVIAWVRDHESNLSTTAITLAEIQHGIERLPSGRRRTLLRSAADEVFGTFQDLILPFDARAASHYSLIVAARQRAGEPIDGFDAQIASICRARAAALATRNSADFRNTGIRLIDPWSS
jgi:predicted nucleic acid-binding protein